MRWLRTLTFATVFFAATAAAATPLTCDEIKSKLHSGDLLFIGLNSKLFKYVARATMTWVAHTAYVLQDASGKWTVYESKVPLSTRTELCAFVARAVPGEIAAARWNGLSAGDLAILKSEGEKRMGIVYQQKFDYDSGLQFCSKFVHDIFAQIPGSPEIGRLETFGDVMDRGKRELPPADYAEIKSFFESWFGGSIPVVQRTVTPESVFADSDLQLVFDRQAP